MSRRAGPYALLVLFAGGALAPLPWLVPVLAAVAVAVAAIRAASFLRHLSGRSVPSADTVDLGRDGRGRPVSISERELAAHGLILGASGAGKTTTLMSILAQLIERGRPVVVIDMKGSPTFAQSVRQATVEAGRPFVLWTPDGPSSWNPLQYGNATELKDKLVATERFTEPHYQRAAERYVQTVIQVLQRRPGARPPTLAAVVRLMDPHRLRGALRDVPEDLRDRVQDYLAALTPDQLSAVRGLQTRLAILTESHTGAFLERAPGSPSADLRRALNGQDVVLFSLNSSRYGKLAAQLGTLAVQDLVCAAGDRLAQRGDSPAPPQAYVVLDEASILGGDHVLALFARGREAGVGVVAVTQELADFDRAAPGLRDQILGNTAVKLAHRQEVPTSAQTIAQLAGTEKAWEETQQLGGPLSGGIPTGRGTRRPTEQFVVHPNVIKSLRTGEAVLISKLQGQKARTVRVSPRAPRPASRDGPEL